MSNEIIVRDASNNNLKNISVSIPLNRYVALMGKSGSGKSTLAVDVILAGYIKKYYNVIVPVKPELFKQRTSGYSKKCSLLKFMELNVISKNKELTVIEYLRLIKITSKFTAENLLIIAEKLGILEISMNKNISEMSLTEYNKCRFLKLLISSEAELFIIDELCAGMIYEEACAVADIFKYIVSLGFSIIAIEHSLPIISSAEYVVVMGPEAGINGGKVVFAGEMSEYKKRDTWKQMILTYNTNININQGSKKLLKISDVNYHSFSKMEIKIPLEGIVAVCGGMCAGKSSMLEIIYRACDKSANAWKNRKGIDGEITGKNYIRRPYIIDQTPIGNNSMSTPATYASIMDSIRNFYYNSKDNEIAKMDKSEFSYNGTGKCLKCGGTGCFETDAGTEKIYITCSDCGGKRYKKSVEIVKENGLMIGEVLTTSCKELYDIYKEDRRKKNLNDKIGFINEVGLSYLTLGQPSSTLSGGESQRIKITKELAKKLGDRCLFILDSPAKGLHVEDLPDVMKVLKKLVSKNNSIIISENNPFFIYNADWVIYLDQGKIIYQGEPINLPTKCKKRLGIGVNV
ncbi:ATP-binding cassette domain-containing protein [Clostridium sp. 19966]|uniref:ATP-binding cassette domain-containing protein n=1 Tax=Clostridium sp. 19966 TaxID=2768166 RepID=UPI0028DECCD5|nr:ATP-binding cassette domain-containing protein [Clostridium sp. 19966]MDT8716075.1 ATP-binding cassette domain-containing protein [Clostridium sp. 19966]